MHPSVIEKNIRNAQQLGNQDRHPEALEILEEIKHFIPNSPVTLLMRVENLVALGKTGDAVHDCDRLIQQLDQIRAAGNTLNDLLDTEQNTQLTELVTNHRGKADSIKAALDERQAEALNKETLQNTVADLQSKLEAFLAQKEDDATEQNQLLNELESLRETDQERSEALEQAHSELDNLKHSLLEREVEVADAEQELADREKMVAKLENEVNSLQERQENAAQSKDLLDQEVERLRKQGDAKNEELEQAREALETLQASLKDREKAVEDAQFQNKEHEDALAAMRDEMTRINSEADKAESARETLKSELETLRENERDKSEALETARTQLNALQNQLTEREEAVASAEERARESEKEISSMHGQLDQIQSRAEHAANSERALADEVAQLRANEAKKSGDLQKTRGEMERLRNELGERESMLNKQLQEKKLGAAGEKKLQEELEQLRQRANHFAESEQGLVNELDLLRSSESEKSKVLTTARSDMDQLRGQLAEQQEAVATAEEASTQHDEMVQTLQQELETLQQREQTASSSEEELAQEVTQLRENEESKSQALSDAQAEMEQLREQLTKQEEDAKGAEEKNEQKQRELETLQEELNQLRSETLETQDTENALTGEMEKLRQNEAEKNEELEKSRKELDALKEVLNDREEVAAKAAEEQVASRETISNLEDELAALRNKDIEQQSSQVVLQAEVSQITDAVKRNTGLENSPQALQLKKIQDQLQSLEKARRDQREVVRRQAVKMAIQDPSKLQTAAQAATIASDPPKENSGLFAVDYAAAAAGQTPENKAPAEAAAITKQKSQRQTQMDALKIAQQQSKRQTQNDALKIAQQQSKRQTQNDALKIAQQQSKRQTQSDALKVAQQQSQKQTQQQAAKAAAQQLKAMAKPNAAKKKPQKQKTMDDVSPLSVAAPELNPLEAAITGITPDEIQAPFNEPSDDNPVVGIPVEVVPLEAVPTAPKVVPPHGGNTTGSQNEENYPKPRDVAFVFPDQSVSIAIPHRRSRAKVLFAAGFLFLIAVVGMVAFIMQRGPAPAENGTEIANEAVVPIPEPKEKMLHIEFPTTYSFGVLYDPEEQRASDDWPSYAKAQGTVEYVEGKKFHIVIQQEHADNLAPLTTIPPNTISSLRLPDMELTEAVLQNLWQLKGLKILSIDKIISDEEKSKVKNGFSYDVMVTSRDPNEVVRAQTSPGVRTLSFPTDASVGRIAIRKWQKTDQMWQHFELALGDVEIPANMEIQMEISKDVTDLGFLAALQDESNRTVLHSLILSGSSINDTSMEGVSTLKTLYGLEMLQTNVTAAGMNKLIGIRGLEHLKIDGTKLPNDGFEVLKELINLKRVEIYNAPNVTIGILPVFKQLRSLKRLHLENTGITSEQRRQIDTEIDKCTVSPLL